MISDTILFPEILVSAYQQGYFPMADEEFGKIYWHSPDPRAIIPLDKIKIPRSLKQYLRKNNFDFSLNNNFDYVIKKCAERESTWINDEIIYAFTELNGMGLAHSVETYMEGKIVGGLYGVALGGAFFGESMYFDVTNASKAAFYYLAYRLLDRGYVLLDSQYMNSYTESLGAIEIPRKVYMKILKQALILPCCLD